jgi:acylphosphatase
VGFRYTCRSLARDHDVTGFVRNLPDGRVELIAEGDRQEVDRFLRAILGEMGSFIREVDTVSEPPDEPPFSGFTIRH